MNTLIKLIFFCLTTVFFFACNQDKKQEEALYNEVMAIHDEVMPEMGNIMKLVKKINADIASVSDSLSQDSISRQSLLVLRNDLEQANESMMAWMRQFEHVEANTPHDQAMEYLEEQKKGIEQVKLEVENAKQKAEQYLSGD